MAQLWSNRTVFTGDNLFVMRGLDSATVDLIYLDPPFNSDATYSAHSGAKFNDTWTWDTDAEERYEKFCNMPASPVSNVIVGMHVFLGNSGMLSYLTYMAERLEQMHRLLKASGSIYLHCDQKASHYLKLIMDAIFGNKQFLNEIVWYYKGAGVPKKSFARRHDIIFRYAKVNNSQYFDPAPARQPYAKATIERFQHSIGNVRQGKNYGQQKLNPEGKHPDDVIVDIQPVAPSASIRMYPTQKPVALLRRIIQASSKEGDMVLDPFCGSGTTCIAAEVLGRQWIGIDISSDAARTMKSRIEVVVSGTIHWIDTL